MKKCKVSILLCMASVALLSVFWGATPVISQEKPVELTYSNPYTLNIPYAKAAETWIEWIEKESKGRLVIKPYWGGTLISGRETLAEVEKGVADIALGSVYTKSGYEIMWATGTFVLSSPNPEVTIRVSREIFDMFPEYQNEFPNLLVLGFRNVYDNVLEATKPIQTLDDLKGLVINTSTPGDVIFPLFGARTVKVPPPEWYTSMQKGTFQGSFLQLEVLKGFRLGEVAKYVNTDINISNAGIPMTFMNLNKFKSLPADLQKIIKDSIDVLSNEQMKETASAQQEGVDFAKEHGVKFVNLSKEDKERWTNNLLKLGQEEAKKVDAAGKPGTKIFNEIIRLIKEYSK
jgi:TRAP-type C4-dicarboxylate transport system substrate-binding protein